MEVAVIGVRVCSCVPYWILAHSAGVQIRLLSRAVRELFLRIAKTGWDASVDATLVTMKTYRRSVAETSRILELLARPPNVKDDAVLTSIAYVNTTQAYQDNDYILILPSSSVMKVSSAFSGKFVTYKVDFHAKCTVISCPWTRFLSFVRAAGTLSYKVQRVSSSTFG